MRPSLPLILLLALAQGCASDHKSDAPAAPSEGADGVASTHGAFFAKLAWTNGPMAEAPSAATLTFSDASHGQVTSVDKIDFTPWMTTMGHGTSKKDQKITPVADQVGVYTVDGIYFVMGGAWDLRVTATVNGTTDTATLPVTVP